MKGWLKNKGTSVKSRRGNGSKKKLKNGYSERNNYYTYLIGGGARGRKLFGNRRYDSSNYSSYTIRADDLGSWMDNYKPAVSKHRHDNIIARAEIRACTPLRENCW